MSDELFDGGAGLIAMHAACEAKFGEGARMGTSVEFFYSGNAAPVTAEGWLQPVFIAPEHDAVLGTGGGGAKTCAGWRTPGSGFGLIVEAGGSLDVGSCTVQRAVACVK